MPSDAQYELLIPKADSVGNPLIDIAKHAYDFVHGQIPVSEVHVEQNRRVFIEGQDQIFDALVITASDDPLTDSTVKQLAAYVGEVTNQDSVLVSKNGKSGIQTWPIRNPQHRPGESAEGSMIQYG